jgi:hypothetical protein
MRFCLALAGVLLLAPIALAHDSWISDRGLRDPVSGQWCCNQHDCAPEQVREIAGGYLVQTGEVIPHLEIAGRPLVALPAPSGRPGVDAVPDRPAAGELMK